MFSKSVALLALTAVLTLPSTYANAASAVPSEASCKKTFQPVATSGDVTCNDGNTAHKCHKTSCHVTDKTGAYLKASDFLLFYNCHTVGDSNFPSQTFPKVLAQGYIVDDVNKRVEVTQGQDLQIHRQVPKEHVFCPFDKDPRNNIRALCSECT
ncbi:hypothetical protein O181_031164 [Austropuccinia psidii MF-1]|uniref:Secreted protein n=1 Tax=Austropuccinia psidii MF-1 TaxID=1389203 RepID=A0A9Q3CV70_9BASI|nr:hypothetical protein [Austropuccinia psidii MF-1]